MDPRPPALPSTLPELDSPEASPRTLVAIAGLGVAFDLAVNGQRPGLSIPLFVVLFAAALRTVIPRSRETDVLLGGAIVLSIFPALRATLPLVSLNILASSALIALAATAEFGPITQLSFTGLFPRALAFLERSLHVPRFLRAPFTAPGDRRRTRVILRTTLLVAPILALFASLLASGDRVFARLLSSFLPEWNLSNLLSHVALTLAGIVMVAIVWRTALGNGSEEKARVPVERDPILGFTEWATLLGGIDLLFAAFVVVQFAYLFGGHHRVSVTKGLSYAEYARSGFFQLAAAAALTILVILATWDAGRRDHPGHERWFRGLVTAMVCLTGVVLASAVTRLALYEGTFGFTTDRFVGYVAIVAIGAILLVLLGAIWWSRRANVVAGFLAVAFLTLLTINVMNPERFVAERNIARFEATGKIDVDYLGSVLGNDAVPVLAAFLDRFTEPDAARLREALCIKAELLAPEPSWRSANLGRSSARTALETAGITPATCGNAPPAALR